MSFAGQDTPECEEENKPVNKIHIKRNIVFWLLSANANCVDD